MENEVYIFEEVRHRKVRIGVVAREKSRELLVEGGSEERALAENVHEEIDRDAVSLDQPQAERKGSRLSRNELIERKLQGSGLPNRTDQARLAAQNVQHVRQAGKLRRRPPYHDDQGAGVRLSDAAEYRRFQVFASGGLDSLLDRNALGRPDRSHLHHGPSGEACRYVFRKEYAPNSDCIRQHQQSDVSGDNRLSRASNNFDADGTQWLSFFGRAVPRRHAMPSLVQASGDRVPQQTGS
jgi:hypothetical protein